jgi:hypothetical protein
MKSELLAMLEDLYVHHAMNPYPNLSTGDGYWLHFVFGSEVIWIWKENGGEKRIHTLSEPRIGIGVCRNRGIITQIRVHGAMGEEVITKLDTFYEYIPDLYERVAHAHNELCTRGR